MFFSMSLKVAEKCCMTQFFCMVTYVNSFMKSKNTFKQCITNVSRLINT